MEWAVFIAGALIAILGAVGVITSENPVHSAMALVGTLFGIAVLFIAQDAEFLAAVQIIVYAGAIVVMFLFVIMLLGVDKSEDITLEPLTAQRPLAAVAGIVVALGLGALAVFGSVTGRPEARPIEEGVPNPEQIGRLLFTDYLWAFEIISILLIIAVVGAVVLTRKRGQGDDLPGDELPAADPADDEEVTA